MSPKYRSFAREGKPTNVLYCNHNIIIIYNYYLKWSDIAAGANYSLSNFISYKREYSKSGMIRMNWCNGF